MDGVFFPLFIFGFVYMVAINQGRRNCPKCGEALGVYQSPFTRTKRQWLEGGYLCANCGCETDLAGKKVMPVGHRPWFVRWRNLLTMAIVLASSLVFAIGLFRLPDLLLPAPAPLVRPPVLSPAPGPMPRAPEPFVPAPERSTPYQAD